MVLKMEHYQVVLAENYEEALLLARVMRFDVYIMDNWMPGGSGVELCRKVREFDPTTPIIFYSGAAYDSDKREAFAAGAQAYLTKPVDNDTLILTVAQVVGPATASALRSPDALRILMTSLDVKVDLHHQYVARRLHRR